MCDVINHFSNGLLGFLIVSKSQPPTRGCGKLGMMRAGFETIIWIKLKVGWGTAFIVDAKELRLATKSYVQQRGHYTPISNQLNWRPNTFIHPVMLLTVTYLLFHISLLCWYVCMVKSWLYKVSNIKGPTGEMRILERESSWILKSYFNKKFNVSVSFLKISLGMMPEAFIVKEGF